MFPTQFLKLFLLLITPFQKILSPQHDGISDIWDMCKHIFERI